MPQSDLPAPPRAPAATSQQYDVASRPVGPIPGPPPIQQWPVPQPEPAAYLQQSQPGPILASGAPNPTPDGHPGMHDPAMLQAAQLLIPGDYQAPGQCFEPMTPRLTIY